MGKIELYRRRFIPEEIVHLKDDIIEYSDDALILTRWKVLRPKTAFTCGRSCYFLHEGYKISRFFDANGVCVCTYCDIISVERTVDGYICSDLLVDVVIDPDGHVRVLDLGEVAEALDRQLITIEQAKAALAITDKLLAVVYAGELCRLLPKAFLETCP